MQEMKKKLQQVVTDIHEKYPDKKLFALVIDDDQFDRTLRSRLLRSIGFTVDVANSGEYALTLLKDRLAKKEMYFVISSDYQMGKGMNGAQTIAKIVTLVAEAVKHLESEKAVLESKRRLEKTQNFSRKRKESEPSELALLDSAAILDELGSRRKDGFSEACASFMLMKDLQRSPRLLFKTIMTDVALRQTQSFIMDCESFICWGVSAAINEMKEEVAECLKKQGDPELFERISFTDKDPAKVSTAKLAIPHRYKKMSEPSTKQEGFLEEDALLQSQSRRNTEPAISYFRPGKK